jgi:hypothetical protein
MFYFGDLIERIKHDSTTYLILQSQHDSKNLGRESL